MEPLVGSSSRFRWTAGLPAAVALWQCWQTTDAREQEPSSAQSFPAAASAAARQPLKQSEITSSPNAALTDTAAAPASNNATAQWRIYTDIARDLVNQGRHAEAEAYLRRALAAAQAGFGAGDPHAAAAANNLAELHRLRRDFAAAQPLYEQALQTLEASYGDKDPRLGAALHNVGGFFMMQRQYAQAQQYYSRAVQVKTAALGAHHPDTSNSLFHLAEALRGCGRKQEALAVMQEWQAAAEEQGGGIAAGAVRRMGRLAELLAELERHEEAEQQLRRVLQYTQQAQGEGSLAAAQAQGRLATALQRGGKQDEAAYILQNSIHMLAEHHGPRHPAVAGALQQLAELMLRRNDPAAMARATEYAERAVLVAQEHWEGGQPGAGGWFAGLWGLSSKQQQQQQPGGIDAAAVAFGAALQTLARAQQAAGKLQEAEASLLRALAVLQETPGAEEGMPTGDEAGADQDKVTAAVASGAAGAQARLRAQCSSELRVLQQQQQEDAVGK